MNRSTRRRNASTALAVFGLLLLGSACSRPAPEGEPGAASTATAPAEDAAPLLPLWRLTDDGRTLYLLGSIHLLRPEVYPLDAAIYSAFEEAEVVAFEIDLDEMAAAAPVLMQRGTYHDDRTLRDVLPDGLYAEFAERVAGSPLPMEAVERMKPWMASLTLSSVTLQQDGFDAAAGVDLHMHERAKEAGKEVIGLETVEEQVEIFEGMSEEAQAAMLRSTLEVLDEAASRLDETTELWRSGRTDELAGLMVEELGDQPETMERLLHERNRRWVPQIEGLLDARRPAIVVVGVGHLAGPESVIDLLRDRGYEVGQIRATPDAAEPSGEGASPDDGMSSDARRYLERALRVMQTQSMNRDSLDWDRIRSDAFEAAAGASEPRETHATIEGALRALGDGHSHLRPPESERPEEASDEAPTRPQPESRRADDRIGYIRITQFSGPDPDSYARKIASLVRKVDAPAVCGWIVDVRGNGGGNMWPMLQGLSAVLGEGTPGYFVGPDGTWTPWMVEAAASDTPLDRPDPAVALLHDRETASSGEAVVVAFRGREHTRTFGEPTRGLSTANNSIRLSDGAMMMVTIAVFADRDRTLYGGPIEPDEAVDEGASDPAAEAAASAWLHEQPPCRDG